MHSYIFLLQQLSVDILSCSYDKSAFTVYGVQQQTAKGVCLLVLRWDLGKYLRKALKTVGGAWCCSLMMIDTFPSYDKQMLCVLVLTVGYVFSCILVSFFLYLLATFQFRCLLLTSSIHYFAFYNPWLCKSIVHSFYPPLCESVILHYPLLAMQTLCKFSKILL